MKRIILIFSIVVISISVGFATQIQAYLSYAIFNTPENEPYIETYIVLNGNTIEHVLMDDGTFQGLLDVQITFRINDSIVNFGKYELSGPKARNKSKVTPTFLDVQRYALPQGKYQMELTLNDKNSPEEPLVTNVQFEITFPEDELYFSDIELLHSFSESKTTGVLDKNGYELIPFVFNYYPEVITSLSFYSELYNGKEVLGDDQFMLYYYIRPYEVDRKMDQYFYSNRMKAEPVSILLNTIDISQLPSGNYLLVLETRDRENKMLSQKETFFQRHNPNAEFNLTNLLVIDPKNTFVAQYNLRDSLALYIDYLYPISTESEKNYAKSLVKSDDVETMQRYFLNFWMERNPTNPEESWQEYKLLVAQANHNFRSLRIKGYKTDRGRVYLQYGKPNVIAESHNEPAAYPYEIWHYYQLQGQSDKKFVFYTKEIATNDFQLIHSNAVGELTNIHWQTFIYSRTWDPQSVDDLIYPSTYGSFATDYYLQPR